MAPGASKGRTPKRASSCWQSCNVSVGRSARQRTMIASFVQWRKGTEKHLKSSPPYWGDTDTTKTSIPTPSAPCFPGCNDCSRQSPGLVLPFLTSIPTSFTPHHGDDRYPHVGASLVELGLARRELWERTTPIHLRSIRDSIRCVALRQLEQTR